MVALQREDDSHFANLNFAHDIHYVGKFTLDLLIGSEQLCKINHSDIIKTDPDGVGPCAHKSRLGYFLSVPVPLCHNFERR